MFNLLVSGDGTAWEAGNGSIEIDRFKEYSGQVADRVHLDDPESLRQLEEVPALLMYEELADGPNPRLVRHGRLQNITRHRNRLTFDFLPDLENAYLDRGIILELAVSLGIHRFERYRTHWAIKDGALPQQLLDAALPTPPVRDELFSRQSTQLR